MPDVLLATCGALPAGDEDAAQLSAALAGEGLDARWAVWCDPLVDWTQGLVVLRSTWDYTDDRARFLEWVGGLPRVANEHPVVQWNTDKVYLRDLAAAGVPTVKTYFATPGEPPDSLSRFAQVITDDYGCGDLVIKPSVGAGSRGVGRFPIRALDRARDHLDDLQRSGSSALVQPYLDAVETSGETALIYFDGAFSHAVRKGPMLPRPGAHGLGADELYVDECIEARTPSSEELAVGSSALRAVRQRYGSDQLYARVDLLPGPDGPRLVELELTEPSLFLQHGPDRAPAARFAAAIAARA